MHLNLSSISTHKCDKYLTQLFFKENFKDSLNESPTNLENGREFVFTGLEKKVSKAGLEKKRNFAITMNIF